MKRFLGCLILVQFYACSTRTNFNPSLEYMPTQSLLEEGVVAKFYKHNDKAKGGQKKTDIGYRKYQLMGETLMLQDFNAEFAPTYEAQINIAGGQWITQKEISITPGTNLRLNSTATEYSITDSIQLNWNGQTARKSKSITQYGRTSNMVDHQTSKKDTVYESRPAAVFSGVRDYSRFMHEDSVTNEYTWKRIYAQGLGLLRFESNSNEYKYTWELAELLSMQEYENRKNHGMHRVGWIDTTQVLDKNSKFSTCHHFDKICDYYNDERAVFKGKKGAIRALLEEKLDKSKINGESGYLTYRFVVNCKNEAGWFTTEEADLQYNKKQFSEAARSHLFEIFNEANSWSSLKIRGEERDAYVYITLKIKDGEIIEILP